MGVVTQMAWAGGGLSVRVGGGATAIQAGPTGKGWAGIAGASAAQMFKLRIASRLQTVRRAERAQYRGSTPARPSSV